MMRLTKRVLSAFLAFVMVFTMLPLESWASGANSGTTNFGSVVEDRASATVTLAVKDTTTVTGSQRGTWSVKKEDKNVIRIVSGGNSRTVTIEGLAEGTATLRLSYGYGPWSGEEEYTVTVTSAVSADPQTAYFYVRKPSVPDSAGYVMMWAYAGTGTITGEIGSPANAVGNSKFYEGNAADAIISAPQSYPNLEYDGETYRYSTSGEPYTYTINWSYVICSDGANDGASGTVVPSGTPTWHVDGFANLVTPSKIQVNFMVQEPGQADYVIVDDALGSFMITEGEAVGKAPTMQTQKSYDGIPYHFDGWYLDKECTNQVSDVLNYEPTGNVTFYGKYVPDVPDENRYSAEVNIYAGNKGSGELIGTKTLTDITWEELTEYYKLAHYQVANEFWEETILTNNNELYTSQWTPSQANPALTQNQGDHVLNIYLRESAPGWVTITYDANGGINPPDAYDGVKGDTYSIAEPGDMSYEGYDFVGWNTQADGKGTAYSAGQTITLESDLTLYAQWTKKVHTGSNITVRVIKDDAPFDAQGIITLNKWEDKTLDIKFLEGYTYSVNFKYEEYDAADFLMSVGIPEGYHVASVESSQQITQSNQGGEDITFNASDTSGNAGTNWSLDNVPGGAVVTVTLKKLEYTVTYTAKPDEGGSVTLDTETVVYGGNGLGSTAQAKDGYYFTNWTNEEGAVVSTDVEFVPQHVTEDAAYTAHFVQQTTLTVTAGNLTKVYDGTPIKADNTKYRAEGLQNGHSLEVMTEVSASVTNVGETGQHLIDSVKVLDSEGNDVTYLYDVTTQPGTLTINPRPVTVKADDKTKTYGQGDPDLTATVDGTLGEDKVVYDLAREVGEDVGSYTITPSGAATQGNYTVEYKTGTLTITKAGTLTVSGEAYNDTYDGQTHGDAATTNVTAGTTIEYSTDGGKSWSETVPTIKDVGSIEVQVRATNPNYETATNSYTLTVTPKKVTVKAEDKTKTYGQGDPDLTATVDGTLGEDKVVYDLAREVGEDVGSYTITPSGAATQGNYTVEYKTGTLTINPKAIEVKANPITVSYGESIPAYSIDETALEEQLVGTDTVDLIEYKLDCDYPEDGDGNALVGVYDIVFVDPEQDQGNYEVTFTPAKLTVTAPDPTEFPYITKSHDETKEYYPGDTVTYTITVKNIFSVDAVVTVTERSGVTLVGADDGAITETLKPGTEGVYTATYTVDENDLVDNAFHNTVSVKIVPVDDGMDPIEDDATDTVPVNVPELSVEKQITSEPANDKYYVLKEEIAYKITVKNTGNVTVSNITVEDKPADEVWTIESLNPGESKEFETSHRVAEADLGSPYVNVATAEGEAPNGSEVKAEDSATATTDSRTPKLDVTKTASDPANGTEYVLDETITYTITVKNTGNVTLADIFVSDEFSRDGGTTWDVQKDKLTPSASTPITLEPGEQKTYTYQYTVVEEDLGKTLKNTATATAPNPDDPGKPVTDEDTTDGEKVEDRNPDLSVDKEVTSDPGADGVYDLGDTITYTITVRNEGNVTLTGVNVVDELLADGVKIHDLDVKGGDNITLAPKGHEGDSVTLYVDYTVKEEDLGKKLKNTATATAEQTEPEDPDKPVEDKDQTDGEDTKDPTPDMIVDKTVVNGKASYQVGDVITYQITVSNTGNTTIHNVELMDHMNAHGKVTFKNLGGGQMVGGSPVLAALAPKTAWVVTCQYTVQLADADSDGTTISNKVTVNAEDGPDGKDPEDQTPGEDIDPIYTLTIKYQNGARVDLRNPDTVKLHAGDVYTVVAPGINGYHLSDKAYAEFDFTMRDRDTTIVIIYAANPVEDDDDDPVVNPDNDPDETTEETTEETEDEVDPGVYIEDPDDYTLTPITEEEPPLADLDVGDHTCCIMHFLLMLAAMVVLGFYTDSKKKHQARIFELKRTLAMEKGKNPDGDNSQQS